MVTSITFTYDHRLRRTGHPVRSAIHKPQIGRSVVEWVTISESLLLYVFRFSFWRCGLGGVGWDAEGHCLTVDSADLRPTTVGGVN